MSINSRLPDKPAYADVIACQFSSWYPTFSGSKETDDSSDSIRGHKWKDNRKSVTIKSVIIKNLSQDFISYMLSDGITLPPGATKVSSFIPEDSEDHDTWSSDSDQDKGQGHDDDDETDDSDSHIFELSDLTEQINHGIKTLGGSVIPKLNWSAPRDASWINNGSLRCETAGDVYLLVKSSDFCLNDILYGSDSLDAPTPGHNGLIHELVLRKWCNLWPSMEFRCFVANHNISTFQIRFSITYHKIYT